MLRHVVILACSVALLACVMETPSTAQTLDKRTLFTFSGPVSMPGVTLPAGKYLFRLANPDSGRNVVQVLNAEGTKPYGMFFAMRAERFEPAPTPEVRFMETAAGDARRHQDLVVSRRARVAMNLSTRRSRPAGSRKAPASRC